MAEVDRAAKTYETWRREDAAFAKKVDDIRAALKEGRSTQDVDAVVDRAEDFVSFRRRFFGMETYPHQQQWVDVLEGRDPVEIPGTEFRKRDPRRIIVNVPPFHAKSQTLTVDYSCWRIANDPNVRIIIISKRQSFAEKFLYQIKQRLTSPRFAEFQAAYAPKGGWKPTSEGGVWSKSTMYVAGRTSDSKDPTLEAVGITGQIYGARADLIIVDDAVVLSNANEFDKQVQWLESEAWSRLKNGRLIVIGTRMAPRDMYSELLDDERYLDGESPWTYLRQPMVLNFTDDPETWTTLWPRSNQPSDASDEPLPDGTYRAWDGPAAAKIRGSSTARVWSLVYQQQSISEDAAFDPMCIAGSTDGLRRPGPLTAGAAGHPERGKEGLYTIASMDPAMSGSTFSIVASVDRTNSNIWVENAWERKSPPATYFREHIMEVSEIYDVDEWVIEEQGFQGFLSNDPELSRWLAARGIKLVGHYTGGKKNDPDYGVASISPLFGRMHKQVDDKGVERRRDFTKGSNLLHLPRTKESPGLQTLVDQLITWEPGRRGSKFPQDGPMALWFLVERARVYLGHRLEPGARPTQPQTHLKTPLAMRRHQGLGMGLPPALQRRMTFGGAR